MKSFILSAVLSAIIIVFFMSLFDTRARGYLNSLSNAISIALIIVFFVGYLLALYWGVTGILKEQRIFNFLGICFSLFGLGIYAVGYEINSGSGKETPGQFDHDLAKIETSQRSALNDLLQQTNAKESDVQLVNYWGMNNNPGDFVICLQKGNIIALQIKNKTVTNIKTVSKMVHLNWLILENCDLTSIADLNLPYLQRLSLTHNHLTSLNGFENEPQVLWIDFRDNPITDSSALKNHPKKELYVFN